jgi:hypothetical protein
MDDRPVLHIDPPPDPDGCNVPANDDVEPEACKLAYRDVPKDGGVVSDEEPIAGLDEL